MILVDTSAWVEFLRGTGSPACQEVDRLLEADLAITDAVLMEVLAGAQEDQEVRRLRALLGRAELLACTSVDFPAAAQLYRQCRQQGETVRRMIDCLIAATAVRHAVPVLHADADFAVLARHTALELHRIPGS